MTTRLCINKDIITRKDKKIANCLNFLYYHKKCNLKSKTNRWTCTFEKCFGSITTNHEEEIVKINGIKLEDDPRQQLIKSHKHEPHEEIYIDTIQSLHNLKVQVRQKTTSSLSSIYNQEQNKLIQKYGKEYLASNFPEFKSIRSGLYKNKKKNYQKLQANVEELITQDDFPLTEEGKRFLLNDIKMVRET
jgi:hypothetical protein